MQRILKTQLWRDIYIYAEAILGTPRLLACLEKSNPRGLQDRDDAS